MLQHRRAADMPEGTETGFIPPAVFLPKDICPPAVSPGKDKFGIILSFEQQ